MVTKTRKAGSYELKSFKLYKLEKPEQFIQLKMVVPYWELTESMNSGHLYGSATIIDSEGLLDYFIDGSWLKGEEEIEIVYSDFYEELDLTHKMFLYSITHVDKKFSHNETALGYKLHFVSLGKFYTERELIRRSFSNSTIDQYVNSVFNQYYKKEQSQIKISTEQTTGKQSLTVPNYSPEQTMHFFARRSYSEENPTGTYRFFENRDQYYFTTHENLVKGEGPIGNPSSNEIPFFFQVNEADQTSEGQLILMQNVISIETPQHVNTISDMLDGAYYKATTELDILNKLIWKTEYRYLDEYQKYKLPDTINSDNLTPGSISTRNSKSPMSILPSSTRSKHSKEFVDEHLSHPRDTLVVKDYTHVGTNSSNFDLRPSPYYNKVFNQKHVNHYHHMNELITIRVYGRNNLKAGSLIQLEFLKSNSNLRNREIDKERSGTYLVESARNIFDENTYYQVLSISKSGFTGRQESAARYNKEPTVINYEGGSSTNFGVGSGSSIQNSTPSTPSAPIENLNIPSTGEDITEVVTPRGFDSNGNAYTEVKLSDGTIIRRTGTRAWRNNNPGNIEYGTFAKNNGAIGSDGRFAIFPNYQAGRQAKENLLFNTSSYKNRTLSGAISRYAPSTENNTERYIDYVSNSTGVNRNTVMSDIPQSKRSDILSAMEEHEGFKTGSSETIQKGVS